MILYLKFSWGIGMYWETESTFWDLGISTRVLALKLGNIQLLLKNSKTAFSTSILTMIQKVWKKTFRKPSGLGAPLLLRAKTTWWISYLDVRVVNMVLIGSVINFGITSSTKLLTCKNEEVQKKIFKWLVIWVEIYSGLVISWSPNFKEVIWFVLALILEIQWK